MSTRQPGNPSLQAFLFSDLAVKRINSRLNKFTDTGAGGIVTSRLYTIQIIAEMALTVKSENIKAFQR